MHIINIYMSLIALIGASVYYIQSYKIFKRKSAADLSVTSYSLCFFTSINWLVYGIVIADIPLILSGVISTLGTSLVLLGIFKYSTPDYWRTH